jgi:RNA polymerase sigma-70 factor (ECF subfamily)
MSAAIEPAAVIREHASFVWRVLRHLGVADQHLDDLCQEVFLVVLRQLATFEGRSSLRTWIYGICRNVTLRARSERKQLREVPTLTLPDLAEPATQDRELWLKQAYTQLLAALDTLDLDQRSVFVLYELEELPMEEIAAALGAPLTTCYSRLLAARTKIEALLRRNQQRVTFQVLRGGMR